MSHVFHTTFHTTTPVLVPCSTTIVLLDDKVCSICTCSGPKFCMTTFASCVCFCDSAAAVSTGACLFPCSIFRHETCRAMCKINLCGIRCCGCAASSVSHRVYCSIAPSQNNICPHGRDRLHYSSDTSNSVVPPGIWDSLSVDSVSNHETRPGQECGRGLCLQLMQDAGCRMQTATALPASHHCSSPASSPILQAEAAVAVPLCSHRATCGAAWQASAGRCPSRRCPAVSMSTARRRRRCRCRNTRTSGECVREIASGKLHQGNRVRAIAPKHPRGRRIRQHKHDPEALFNRWRLTAASQKRTCSTMLCSSALHFCSCVF